MFRQNVTIILLFTCFIAFSQEKKKVPIPTLYNTGVDNNKLLLADGETDEHYLLSVSADNNFTGPGTKVVYSDEFPIGTWINNDNSSKWIAPRADAGEFNAAGVYIYTLTFSLHEFKHQTAEIRGFWTTDNNGVDIIINGKGTGFQTDYTSFASGFYPFEIKEGFTEGFNTVSFMVFNGEAPTGLRVVIYGEAEPKEFADFSKIKIQ